MFRLCTFPFGCMSCTTVELCIERSVNNVQTTDRSIDTIVYPLQRVFFCPPFNYLHIQNNMNYVVFIITSIHMQPSRKLHVFYLRDVSPSIKCDSFECAMRACFLSLFFVIVNIFRRVHSREIMHDGCCPLEEHLTDSLAKSDNRLAVLPWRHMLFALCRKRTCQIGMLSSRLDD